VPPDDTSSTWEEDTQQDPALAASPHRRREPKLPDGDIYDSASQEDQQPTLEPI